MSKLEVDGLTFYDLEKTRAANIYDDIFLEEVYCRDHFIEIEENDLVVDLGSHIGIFSTYAAAVTDNIVFAFEPSKEIFILAIKNNNINSDRLSGKIFSINLGISNINGLDAMFIGDFSGRNSCNKNENSIDKIVNASFITFEDMMKFIGYIDFLKIDIEGKEDSIFIKENRLLFYNIRKISLEYHDYCSKINHHEIKEYLESLGFEVKISGLEHIGYLYARRVKNEN